MRTAGLVALTDLHAGQWGLVTTAQAQQAGISRMQLTRLAEAGVLDRVAHGVYASPAVLGDELLGLRAAWIALQPRRAVAERLADPVAAGVVSHTSAAHLHRLGELLADVHELTLPERYQSTRPGVRVHRRTLARGEITLVAGLPVTTAARTTADLLADGHDLEHVGRVAADAVRAGSAGTPALVRALEPLAHRHGAPDATELTSRLLRAGGLDPRDLGDRPVRAPADTDLSAPPGADALIDDLAVLGAVATTSPDVRVALATLADHVRSTDSPVEEALQRLVANLHARTSSPDGP
jgi:hypothetical protein